MTPERTPGATRYRAATLDRRALLRAGVGMLAVAGLPGCGFFETDADNGESEGKKGKEAPSLKKRADAGDLPPVAERLPDKPREVTPLEKTGVYGGTWHSAMLTQEDMNWLRYSMGYEPLVRWAPEWRGVARTEILPNVCEKYEVRGGGKEFVFHLRKGLKWSDGKPVTTDDFAFAFADFNADKEMHTAGVYE
ncbi:ABC transporter substrate-binding protein, partial [Streptomyces sp. 2MCAF27]